MTQIGMLDKRIAWEAPTFVSDGMGGSTVTYSTICTTWAAIWPVSATEQIKSATPTMVATHRIRIRYRAVFSASWKGFYNGRYFSIVSKTDPSEFHEWLDLLCKEVVA